MSIYEGLLIRKARKAAGYTQEQLSEKIGLSLAPINQVENGWESLNSPIDDYNHAIDALRYLAMMELKKKQEFKFSI